MTLEQQLRNHIVASYLPGEDPENVHPNDNLIDSGILDSMAIMQIVTHLEKDYGISIRTEEIDPYIFASINSLAAFVTRKQTESGAGARKDDQ